jgi:hypothetical protein
VRSALKKIFQQLDQDPGADYSDCDDRDPGHDVYHELGFPVAVAHQGLLPVAALDLLEEEKVS